jgi:hypothetical protein
VIFKHPVERVELMMLLTSTPPVGVADSDGVGVPAVLQLLWQSVSQYSGVVPHHPYLLQHSPLAHTAPPAWLPHCSAEAPSKKAKERIKVVERFIFIFEDVYVDESNGGGYI